MHRGILMGKEMYPLIQLGEVVEPPQYTACPGGSISFWRKHFHLYSVELQEDMCDGQVGPHRKCVDEHTHNYVFVAFERCLCPGRHRHTELPATAGHDVSLPRSTPVYNGSTDRLWFRSLCCHHRACASADASAHTTILL